MTNVYLEESGKAKAKILSLDTTLPYLSFH